MTVYVPPYSPSLPDWQRQVSGAFGETKARLDQIVCPLDWGAVGDGVTDDTTLFYNSASYAFANGLIFDGKGRTYAVSGNLRFDSYVNPRLRNFELIQLTPSGTINGIPDIDRRTLFISSCLRIEMENVRVNRGTSKTHGSLNSAAGIYIDTGTGHHISNVEVYGDGLGSGFVFSGCTDSTLINVVGHDIGFDSPTATDDLVQGVWINANTDCHFIGLKGYNLTGNATGFPASRFTRGIAVDGNTRCAFIGPNAHSVDQGMDMSGSPASNSYCTVTGMRFKDCASWGLKIANSGYAITVDGGVCIDCGLSGVVISGPSETGTTFKGEFITVINVKAFNTGSNGASWGSHIGFRVLQTSIDTSYPRNVTFIGCEAIDTQTTHTMTTGFSNEPPLDPANPTQMINCKSIGHTTSESSNIYRTGGDYLFRQYAAAPSSPALAQTYYDTVLNKARTWDGAAWNNLW